METKDYWWEKELYDLLAEYHQNDYASSADIILFIAKVIEAEKTKV